MLFNRNRFHRSRWTLTSIFEYLGWWLAALLFLGACTPSSQPVETLIPEEYLPTVIAMTVQAGQIATGVPLLPIPSDTPSLATQATHPPLSTNAPAVEPTGTATPKLPPTSTRQPSRTPSLTPTPQLPVGAIQILSPGPASMVVSPITSSVNIIPGERGTVIVELIGENERILVRKVFSYTPGERVRIAVELEFEIPVVAESARLVVSTEDDANRISALASVELILLSVGQNEINPAGNQFESIIIREPTPNMLVQGGTVVVSGIALPASEDPIIIELLKANGSPAGPSRQVEITPLPEYNGYGTFTTEIPYSVTSTTAVRLVIYERAGRIPGITHLSSIVIYLTP